MVDKENQENRVLPNTAGTFINRSGGRGYISVEEHTDILETILKSHEQEILSILDKVERNLVNNSNIIRGVKYCKVNPLRLKVRSKRQRVIENVKELVKSLRSF